MSQIFVVDGYSILFRTYYSVGEMNTSFNTPIGGVFGFIRAILMLIQRYSVEKIIIALDSGKKTFRSELYQAYKANRVAVPETLVPQFKVLREFLESANISHFQIEGFEADDIIASIVQREYDKNITIVTSDKDLMQLVNKNVLCLDFFKNKVYKESDVIEKFGIEPKYIVDYLGLLGDASDNIPGVKGCGVKGATKLIKEFGSIENILENIDNIQNSKMKLIIENGRENAVLSKQLASLREDVSMPELCYNVSEIDFLKVRSFAEKYEMKSLFYLIDKVSTLQKKLVNIENQSIQGQLL